MTAKAPGSARFLSEGRATAEGEARRVRVRDRVLGQPCLLRFAPNGSASAERLADEADRLVACEHPWLTPVVARFEDRGSASIAGHEPATGYALFDPPSPTIADAQANAGPDERLRAVAGALHVIEHLHRHGLVHGSLGPESVRWRDGAPWIVWGEVGPAWPGGPGKGREADLHAIATLARELLRGSTSAARRVFDRLLTRPAPAPWPTASDVLAELDAIGIKVVAPITDGLRSVARDPIVTGAPHLGRPVVFQGGLPGAGLAAARRALSGLASAGWHTLDLSRATSPLAALHRCLFATERPVTFDRAWVEAVQHALVEPPDRLALVIADPALGSEEGALLESLLAPLACAGIVVLIASPAPIAGACPVGMPAPDATALPVPAGAGEVLTLLRGFPPGIPPRILPALPAATRASLPDLARAGHVRFDDAGCLHVSGAGSEPLAPTLASAVEIALLDPIGGSDPLWRAVTWARSARLDRAAALFAEARRVAEGREDLLAEAAVALAPHGHVGARLFLAEVDLGRGRPHRALAALAALPEGDASRALLYGRALRLCGRAAEAVDGLRAAAAVHDNGPLWCEYAHTLAVVGDVAEAALALDRAARCARPAAARSVLAARAHLARVASDASFPAAALAMLEALQRVDSAPPGLVARAALGISANGEPADAPDLLGAACARAEAIGARHLAGVLHLARAGRAHRAGRAPEALAEVHEALLAAKLCGWRHLERAALVRQVELALATGHLDEGAAPLSALAEGEWPVDDATDAAAALIVARAALARGEPEGALAALATAAPRDGDAVLHHALARAQALVECGRPGEARPIAEAIPLPADAATAARVLALRGRIHVALGRRLLDEARQRLPAAPRATDRAQVGEVLLAWAGEDAVAADLPARAQALERAAGLLDGPARARAEALGAALSAPPPAPPAAAAAPPQALARAVPAAPREVLGVILGRAEEALGIETTLALLDPSRSNNLLLTGPTGAGKRVFAERLARERLGLDGLEEVVLRRTDPQMLVSQLVGTKRGEFTGAVDQVGAIQRAIRSRKALLLDELHTLDRVGQEILLPLLELPRRRFGGLLRSSHEIDGPLHVILATNVDVSGSRWRELFRSDLWFRMSQLHVHLPALAERGPEATQIYFARMLAEEGFDDPEEVLDAHARYALLAQSWEGNLRELHAAARRLARFRRHQGRRLTTDDLPRLAVGAEIPSIAPFGSRDVLETLELNAVVEALRRCDWNQSAAADHLAISKYRMHRILQKHELIDWVRDQRRTASGADAD